MNEIEEELKNILVKKVKGVMELAGEKIADQQAENVLVNIGLGIAKKRGDIITNPN